LEELLSIQDFGVVTGRLLAVLVYGLFLGVAYKMLRLHLEKKISLGGAFLMGLNPVLIHVAPFNRDDIPAALFTALAFFFYLKSARKPKWKYFVLSACFITVTMVTRYNLIPLLFLVIFLHEFLSCQTRISFREGTLTIQGRPSGGKSASFF